VTRIAVVGAGGQVGRQLVDAAQRAGLDFAQIARAGTEPMLRADLRDPQSIESALRFARPSHVVLAAAATNVAYCEENPADSWAVNVDGTAAVERVASWLEVPLVFLSTDYVFDGTAGPYHEEAVPNPINEYGRQKLQAERLVRARADNLVVRTCQVFGPDPRRMNYVLRVADALAAGRRVEAEQDLYGTPTYSVDLASSLLLLLAAGATGTWHVAGDLWLSRFDLAREVARVVGRDETSIAPIETGGAIPRPRLSGLRSIRRHDPELPVTTLATALAAVTHGLPS